MDRRRRVSQLVGFFAAGVAACASVTRVRAPMKAEVPRMPGLVARGFIALVNRKVNFQFAARQLFDLQSARERDSFPLPA